MSTCERILELYLRIIRVRSQICGRAIAGKRPLLLTLALATLSGEDSAVVADGRPHSLSFLFPGRKRFGESTVAP
jgi:hypothetical protein